MATPDNYLSRVLGKGSAIWGGLRLVQDNWQNVFTGLGTARDKTQAGRFVGTGEVTEQELTNLYHQDDTAKRIVALKPQEMLRQGFSINVDDDTEASSAMHKTLRDLDVSVKFRDAFIWARLYGGSAILIGADDGLPADEPLNLATIKRVRFLHVIDKRFLAPDTWFENPLEDAHFGEPERYRITPRRGTANVSVHRSRLILFPGAHTSAEERDRLGMWDHSVLNATYAALRQFNSVWQSCEHLLSDANQAVFKIQGLMGMIAGGQKEDVQTRMQLVDMSRSVARAILLDADGGEEFTREASSFTDASAMLDKFMLRLASAAEIPVSILMGRSPAGQNATGDSDFRWFYDQIRTAQENDLRPRLEQLISVLFASREGPTRGAVPDAWDLKFAPLWQTTPQEQADLQNKQADTDVKYIQSGVLLPEEIGLSRFRSEGWSTDTQIDRDAREQMLEGDKIAALAVPDAAPDAEPKEAQAGNVVLAPTDIAIVVTVDEARASQGLTPWPSPDEGRLTVAEFKARKESEGSAIGAAEGDAAAEEIL